MSFRCEKRRAHLTALSDLSSLQAGVGQAGGSRDVGSGMYGTRATRAKGKEGSVIMGSFARTPSCDGAGYANVVLLGTFLRMLDCFFVDKQYYIWYGTVKKIAPE